MGQVEASPLDEWVDYESRPGVILGPYESLIAMLVWLGEWTKGIKKESTLGSDLMALVPRVHPTQRERLITALLLHGKLDALAGMLLLDTYLTRQGLRVSRRELFGDIVRPSKQRPSPFAHSLEEGQGYPIRPSFLPLEAKDWHTLTGSVLRGLQRAGYVGQGAGQVPRAYVAKRAMVWAGMTPRGFMPAPESRVDWAIFAALGMFQHAVDSDLPVLSVDCAAPVWKCPAPAATDATILKIVWKQVSWLPHPKTFGDALRMQQDERMTALRNAVLLWQHKVMVGDVTDWSDLRADINRQVRYFRRKSWASRVARAVTYAAVPTGIAQTAVGPQEIGISIAAVGTVSQWIADLIERSKSRHWLSMGRDMIERT